MADPATFPSVASVTTVVIVGETRLYCEGIAHLLARSERYRVPAVVDDGLAARDSVAEFEPDVVLVDASMTGSHEVIGSLTRNSTRIRVVALAVDESPESIVRCAEAGASGFLRRSASLDDLFEAIGSAQRGELRCSPQLAGTLLRRVATLAAGSDRVRTQVLVDLTQRELEIADLLRLRLSNKQIASHLGIEFATVKNHVHNILEKLQLRRRQDVPPVVFGAPAPAARTTVRTHV